jgi:hypothetical protein
MSKPATSASYDAGAGEAGYHDPGTGPALFAAAFLVALCAAEPALAAADVVGAATLLASLSLLRGLGQLLEELLDGDGHVKPVGPTLTQDQRPSLTTGTPALAMLSTKSPAR